MAISDPTRLAGASIPELEPGELQALDLMSRPTVNIPIAGGGPSRVLIGGLGVLAGIFLRDLSASTGQAFLSSSTNNAAAANNLALAAGGVNVTTYVTGFQVTGTGATAGSTILVTLGNVQGGPLNFDLTIPAGAGVAITPLIVTFPAPGIPANAANTAVTLNVPSFGAGNLQAAAAMEGYQQAAGTIVAPGVTALTSTGDLLDGLDVNGEVLWPFALPALGLLSEALGRDGPIFTRGLFLNIASGNVRGAVYVKI